MTIGELYDLLREVDQEYKNIEQAKRSLEYGGNADTMERKREDLKHYELMLHYARTKEID